MVIAASLPDTSRRRRLLHLPRSAEAVQAGGSERERTARPIPIPADVRSPDSQAAVSIARSCNKQLSDQRFPDG